MEKIESKETAATNGSTIGVIWQTAIRPMFLAQALGLERQREM